MSKIKFVESTHKYTNEKDEDLISVSKFTERFKEKVDWKQVAQRVAAKKTKEGTPTTTNDILLKWERKRNKASEIGTLFHTIKEQETIDGIDNTFCDIQCKNEYTDLAEDGFKYSIPICELQNNTIYPELMIYDHDFMICGQSDKVVVVKNKIHILDYKTDAEISFVGYSNKWMKAKKLLPPLSHLDECNGNIYSIKMSIYMYLLWKANKGKLKVGDIILEHYELERDPLDDNIPILKDGKPVIKDKRKIILPYRKAEVIAMLNTLKAK